MNTKLTVRHLFLILLIMFLFGSAYPIAKLALNNSVPPLLLASLRMGIVFLCLMPFWQFNWVSKNDLLCTLGFAFCMGVGVFMFMNLALQASTTVSPIIIGAQLAIPFGLICSSFFLKEQISLKKWFFIFLSFSGIVIISFEHSLTNEMSALIFAGLMAFLYGVANVFSRHLKHIPVTTTNTYMSFVGFIVLFILSYFFEGDTITHLQKMNTTSVLLILHSALLVSLVAHLSMFYLYKYYPVSKVLPFYTLFPIFGLVQTFYLFNEVPSLSFSIGGIIVLISVYMLNKLK